MNYIKLLNAAFEKFYFDDRLNPAHVTLYLALFQEWNCSRFVGEISVNRRDLMRAAKIGSKSTYHRCIVNLNDWGYLDYFPSKSAFKGSRIRMCVLEKQETKAEEDFDSFLDGIAGQYSSKNVPVQSQYSPESGHLSKPSSPNHKPLVGSNINSTKLEKISKQPKDRMDVLLFFNAKGLSPEEGKRFFDYYQKNEWRTGDGEQVRDWEALAHSWIKNTFRFSGKKFSKKDSLQTSNAKDYDQPL
ncbi:hypothetical protein OQ279_13135 [Salinimicrobium sp. MT39]|uniref:Uncharacterized protein n=1 Tax=Salinimicrobium profundisediminis TaxID=2994553 RepID=A0A9X3D0P1_9FLAO|nr:hypothetical protein [Salinimicrobium profundisediminis]MCX2839094.1 hypothetical protein [Salinimicrobium profundisediminis]